MLFSKFPLAATTQNGIIALHGALPELKCLEEMKQIELGDENWDRIVWGDFVENEMDHLEIFGGGPNLADPILNV